MVVTLPAGALAAGSLAQDAREARGAVASLVVVAGAAVLTAQHRVVAHPGCREQRKQVGGGWERGGRGEGREREAGSINRALFCLVSCLVVRRVWHCTTLE